LKTNFEDAKQLFEDAKQLFEDAGRCLAEAINRYGSIITDPKIFEVLHDVVLEYLLQSYILIPCHSEQFVNKKLTTVKKFSNISIEVV
jgi:hypothetical protein